MKYFFWIAFAVFLAASIPHVAYFFASFEPSQGPEGVWWWVVSYAIAISIDVTVYLLSWTAFRRYRKYRSPRAVWQHWLLIVICTVFSWGVNWAYAKQFHSPVMLSSAESTAPWLTSVFPFMASAFPLLGIVYTMMAETITEASVEDNLEKEQHLTALGELAKQTQLPIATLQRALTAGTARLSASTLLTTLNQRPASAVTGPETTDLEKRKQERPITGKFVTIEGSPTDVSTNTPGKQSTNPTLVSVSNDVNPDKLQMTIEALKATPDMTDEMLATFLSLKRPASARFWRLKAIEILNAPGKEPSASSGSWTGSMSNGVSARR
jgi:DNA-binding transcriptional regulator YhcF (GntR family)